MFNDNRQDAVVTEIIRNGMVATTEEMKSNLMRTAYNMIIYEALDFTVGVFDREGNTVSIGIGLPMFIRGMSNTVKRMIALSGDTATQCFLDQQAAGKAVLVQQKGELQETAAVREKDSHQGDRRPWIRLKPTI